MLNDLLDCEPHKDKEGCEEIPPTVEWQCGWCFKTWEDGECGCGCDKGGSLRIALLVAFISIGVAIGLAI